MFFSTPPKRPVALRNPIVQQCDHCGNQADFGLFAQKAGALFGIPFVDSLQVSSHKNHYLVCGICGDEFVISAQDALGLQQ